jgi:CheY-like chemotaxis protein
MQPLHSLEAHSAIANSTTTLLTDSLSAATPAADTLPPPTARLAGGTPDLPPILVADDDPDDTFFIQRLIKKTGVKNPVKVFDDGSEVVNYLGARLTVSGACRRIPHLLFLDIRMVGLGGFGFLEWAREQKNLVPLTIVVLSNSNEPADVARALELGAHRYLVKYPCVQTINTIVRSVYPQTVF